MMILHVFNFLCLLYSLESTANGDVRPHMTPRRVKRRSYTRSSARSAGKALKKELHTRQSGRSVRSASGALGTSGRPNKSINPVTRLMQETEVCNVLLFACFFREMTIFKLYFRLIIQPMILRLPMKILILPNCQRLNVTDRLIQDMLGKSTLDMLVLDQILCIGKILVIIYQLFFNFSKKFVKMLILFLIFDTFSLFPVM